MASRSGSLKELAQLQASEAEIVQRRYAEGFPIWCPLCGRKLKSRYRMLRHFYVHARDSGRPTRPQRRAYIKTLVVKATETTPLLERVRFDKAKVVS